MFDDGPGYRRRRRTRQADHEAAAPARLTIRGDRAAVRGGDSPGDGQAQPDASMTEPAGRLGRWNGSNTRGRSSAGMPQPQSSTASATAAGSHQARTMTGVPGSLYLHAFSSRLSTNWPSNGGCARVQSRSLSRPSKRMSAARSWPDHARRWSAAQVPRSRHSRSGRPASASARARNSSASTTRQSRTASSWSWSRTRSMLLGGARAAAGDVDRGDQGGQRSAELVRRLAGELPLPF